jgi:hypothetical protein
MPFVRMYVCQCASLAPELVRGFYPCLAFRSLSFISGCQVNTNIREPSGGPQPLTIWMKFPYRVENISLNKIA